ncbi:MAG: hypothetical protein WAV09_02545 [Minisyncoccia bacterium]
MKQKTLKKFSLTVMPLLALVALSGPTVFAADVSTTNTSFRPRVQITEAQKTVLAQIKTLHEQGKIEEAKALAKSSGIPKLLKPFRGGHKDHANKWPNHENRKKIDVALENNDFATFKTLIANTPFASVVTEATFTKLVTAHALREKGDHEGARKIMDELGFKGHGLQLDK